jgi:hypothetical protein
VIGANIRDLRRLADAAIASARLFEDRQDGKRSTRPADGARARSLDQRLRERRGARGSQQNQRGDQGQRGQQGARCEQGREGQQGQRGEQGQGGQGQGGQQAQSGQQGGRGGQNQSGRETQNGRGGDATPSAARIAAATGVADRAVPATICTRRRRPSVQQANSGTGSAKVRSSASNCAGRVDVTVSTGSCSR